MKLKLIAAAAVLAASGVANAAIDTGTDGSGDFFFSIWDANSSYTFDLNIQQNAFVPGNAYSFDLSADAVFQQFLSTANLATLQWNVLAVESQSAKTMHQTYNTLPGATGINATNGRAMVAATQVYLNDLNAAIGSNNSVIQTSTQPGYAGLVGCSNFTYQNFNTCGTLANNSAETGLGLVAQGVAASGTALSTLTPVAYNGNAVKVYLDSNYNLQIAAVPEPETYAMLLAGLGLMGAIARRRQNKA